MAPVVVVVAPSFEVLNFSRLVPPALQVLEVRLWVRLSCPFFGIVFAVVLSAAVLVSVPHPHLFLWPVYLVWHVFLYRFISRPLCCLFFLC